MSGILLDFLAHEHMSCLSTHEGLVDLVVALSRYREEGVALYPQFVICDELASALGLVGGSEALELGAGPREASTVREALKKCSPLARNQWIVYIHREADAFRFGVFRQTSAPTAIGLRDTIGLASAATASGDIGGIIFVSQIADNVVELVGCRGAALAVHLSAAREDQPSPTQGMEKLVAAVTRSVTSSVRQPCVSFLRAVFTDALRRGHGTLVAVVVGAATPEQLKEDAVNLAVTVDVAQAVAQYIERPSEDTLSRLRAHAELIEGMLSSDGITVFQDDAQVSGFRAFLKDPDAGNLQASSIVGGARRRAFKALRRLVDSHLVVSAFIRSADGAAEYYEDEHDGRQD